MRDKTKSAPHGTTSDKHDYLHRCLALHGKLTERFYGKRQRLEDVEHAIDLLVLRYGDKLDYGDIQQILDTQWTDFSKFWRWPSKEDVGAELERGIFDFKTLPHNEEEVIRKLFRLFRNMEPVSVILRFIDPEDYGIMSAPVEKILQVRRGRFAWETYLNYLEDLRWIRDHRGFKRAAHVDMALWVLEMGVLSKALKGDEEELEREYRKDHELAKIRVRNSFLSAMAELSRADLAEALIGVDDQLAAVIAGMEFELMVRNVNRDSCPGEATDGDLKELIAGLPRGRIQDTDRIRWHDARRARNRAVHEKGTVSRTDIELLLLLAGSGGHRR